MSNSQFYTAIAVPSVLVVISWLLVVLAWMQQDKRLARLESTLDMIAARVSTIDGHLMSFYSVTGEHKGRIEELSARIR